MKRAPVLPLLIPIAGCGTPTAEEQAKKWDAITACVERSSSVFPKLNEIDFKTDRIEVGDLDQSNIRVGSDGHFIMEMPNIAAKRSSPFAWTCTGNVKRRQIEMIEFDGSAKRAPTGQVWSY